MVSSFFPVPNQVYFINRYTLLHILEGQGAIQVDFKNYFDWRDKLIFLDKGQYIQFLSDSFSIRRIEFPDEVIFHNRDVRVLFKHLVALGYIEFNSREARTSFLSNTVFSNDAQQIVDISSAQWYWQNPFRASREEYQVIFDIKDLIDDQYKNRLTVSQLATLINEHGYKAFGLMREKVGLTVKRMISRKRIVESKREIAFSDKSIKEISYDMGYRDPGYFSRSFKNSTGISPDQFRSEFAFTNRDTFIEELFHLLDKHHREERSLSFYAEQLHMSVKSLSRTVRNKLNVSLGQLIRQELIHSAKDRLANGAAINEVAYELGFEEANHFSAFFKHHTGQTPSNFKKYKR